MRRLSHGGYEVRKGDRTVVVMDPEKSLKVGRHDGKLGVVITVEADGGVVDSSGRWHATVRGLLEWDEEKVDGLILAAAKAALRIARMGGVGAPADELARSWRGLPVWTRLVDGMRLGRVAEVMDS